MKNNNLFSSLLDLENVIGKDCWKFPQENYLKTLNSNITTSHIDPTQTVPYQIKQQTKEIRENNEQQLELLRQHNDVLEKNCKHLEELYKIKEKELIESKNETKNSQKYNKKMFIITLISLGVAFASLIVTIIIPFV